MTVVAADGHAPRVIEEAAYETAFLALMDSLACGFKALHDPACTKLLGSLVPGATMAFGARVPGTSLQLDPVQAAFNIGTMVSWLQTNDPALTTVCGHLSDSLGAILAVADYRARKAIAEGASPPTVRDLSATLLDAHEHALLEWSRSVRLSGAAMATEATDALASVSARCALTRIASAASAASLLGGSRVQVAAAAALARSESHAAAHAAAAPNLAMQEPWRIGDATSRGVRLALLALAVQSAPESPSPSSDEAALQREVKAGLDRNWWATVATPEAESRIRDRFAACVASHFPTVQAGKIALMFADRVKLEALPVNELVSMMVRN